MAENSLYSIALKKAMSVCAEREWCTSDIRRKLESWGVSETDTAKITSILKRDNFISEERYALAFVKDRFRHNRWGKIRISSELRRKGIPDEYIHNALASIDDETYLEVIRTLLSNHRKTIKAKNQFDLKGKLFRYALSKGFESSILYDLLNETD